MALGVILTAMIMINGVATPFLEDGKNKDFLNKSQCETFVQNVLVKQYQVKSYNCVNVRGWTAQTSGPVKVPPRDPIPEQIKKDIGTPSYRTDEQMIEDNAKKNARKLREAKQESEQPVEQGVDL